MQIVETKNNLVRVSYDTSVESLVLSGFIVIKDELQSFIGQIIHLESVAEGSFAVVKLLFNFDDEGVILNYNGSIPNLSCPLDIVYPQELLELLPVKNPVVLGELAQQKLPLTIDRSVFENKLLICSERDDDTKLFIENAVVQLAESGKKVLVFDLIGDLDCYTNKITACEDFKLPLNYASINFIYEKGLDDAKAETKAFIQNIFLEVQEYVKTLPGGFIPFDSFKNVVDEQYEETELVELVLLKNKLLKYYEAGVFAQEKPEFASLQDSIKTQIATVFDLSKADEAIQREVVSYAYDLIEKSGEEIYVFFNVNDDNSDKKLLKQIFTAKKSYSTLICSYNYKYLKELKQLSKDLILFAPIQQQNDFAGYNVFLSKLNPHEYVIYGKATHYLPLIIKLNEVKEDAVIQDSTAIETLIEPSLDEQIKKDVDEIYTVPKSEKNPIAPINVASQDEDFSVEVIHDDLTDEDLDFIEDLNFSEDMDEMSLAEANVRKYMEQQSFDNQSVETESFEIVEESIEPSVEQQVEEEGLHWPDEVPTQVQVSIDDAQEGFEPIEEQEQGQGFSFADALKQGEQESYEDIEQVYEEEQDTDEQDALIGQETLEQVQEPPALDILPIKAASTPIVPIYSADVESVAESDSFEQGDAVVHPKYGKGTVEKMISYGSKTLCSINFDNVGRRLLDPTLAEIKKA